MRAGRGTRLFAPVVLFSNYLQKETLLPCFLVFFTERASQSIEHLCAGKIEEQDDSIVV